MLARRDWTSWFESGRLRLLTGPDYRGAATCSRHVNVGPPLVIEHPLLAAHRPADVAAARTVAPQMIADAGKNLEARRRFAGRYLLQTLANLPVIAREADAGALDGLFSGCPPSSSAPVRRSTRTCRRLPRCRIARSSSAPTRRCVPLIKGGVRPHLVAGVRSGRDECAAPGGGRRHRRRPPGRRRKPQSDRVRGVRRRTFTFKVSNHEPWPWLETRGLTRTTLRAWGSVISSAFDLALRLGCNPIVFAGLDLAYTGMRPYCRGTIIRRPVAGIDAGFTLQQVMETTSPSSRTCACRIWRGRGDPHHAGDAGVQEMAARAERRRHRSDDRQRHRRRHLYSTGLRHASLRELLGASEPMAGGTLVARVRAPSVSVAIRIAPVGRRPAASCEECRRCSIDGGEFALNTITDEQISSALREASARHPR